MEGSGHLGPEKSCFDNLTKTPIGNGHLFMHGPCSTVTACKENSNSICAVRTAHGTLIAQNTKS